MHVKTNYAVTLVCLSATLITTTMADSATEFQRALKTTFDHWPSLQIALSQTTTPPTAFIDWLVPFTYSHFIQNFAQCKAKDVADFLEKVISGRLGGVSIRDASLDQVGAKLCKFSTLIHENDMDEVNKMLEEPILPPDDPDMETTVLTKSNNVPLSSSSSMDRSINTLLLPFQCSFCDETFRGHVRLAHHIAWDHQNAKIEIACGICNLVFSKPYNHIKHLFTKHLKGASVDLFEKLKTDLGCDEKWSKQRVYPIRYNQKSKPKVPLEGSDTKRPKPKVPSKESDTKKPRPNVPHKESDTKKSKPKAPPQTKDIKQPEPKSPLKNEESFDCSCGEKLKSREHLDAHKSSHKIRIDPTIKCHLCAGAFDSVDDWLLHTCQRDLSSNLEQDLHVEPELVEVNSRSPSPECANFSVASPAGPQDFDSPVASPAGSPPQNCDSPVASPASPPSTECDLSTPVPSSPPRTRDDFTALLRTFQKVIDDLPAPTRQPLDRVPPAESSPLDEPVYDDDDMQCGSPAEPSSDSPQNPVGQNGGHDPEVPPELTAKAAQESQGVSDLGGQESQQEILQVDLASPPALVQQQDYQPAKTADNFKKSKRGPKNLTAHQRKLQMPPPESPEDLEIFNLLGEFNLQPSYHCDQCAARYKFKLHLVEHKHKYCKITHEKSAEYNGCRMCGQEFSAKEELGAHWTNSHEDSRPKSWACDLCDHAYDWEAALKLHKDTTHRKILDRSIRICRLCTKSFKSVHHIVKHYLAEHPKNYTICKSCGQQFKDRYEKAEHEKREHVSYNNSGKVVCEICGQEMVKSSLKNHIARRHAEKSFLCPNCGESFGSLELLQVHEISHLPTEDKPLSCKFCSYRATQIVSLENHMARRHLDHDGFVEYEVEGKEKPFICDQCGKAYTSEIALVEHRIFHGERKYKCRKCGEFMFTRYHLVAHRLEVHQAEKDNFPERRPCPNPNCPKTFKTRVSLYIHRRTCGLDPTAGSTSKAYQCAECGKMYGLKNDLTYHIRSVHSKTYAFYCEVCGKGSNSKSNLKAHMKIHGGGYECEVCKLKFLTFPILSQHYMDEHGKEPTRAPRKQQGGLRSIVESLKESSEMTPEEIDP